MSTSAQIAANQKNAQLSSGPTSPEGKAKSSLNAVKTGLTGRTVLLPGDDAAAYETHIASFFATYKPVADEEHKLVQSLADTEWRLLRIPALEYGIYALGRLEFAAEFAQEDPDVRKHLIEAKIFLAYQRQLTEQLLRGIRSNRAKVAVLDITGVPYIDSAVANHLVHQRDAQTSSAVESVLEPGFLESRGLLQRLPEPQLER